MTIAERQWTSRRTSKAGRPGRAPSPHLDLLAPLGHSCPARHRIPGHRRCRRTAAQRRARRPNPADLHRTRHPLYQLDHPDPGRQIPAALVRLAAPPQYCTQKCCYQRQAAHSPGRSRSSPRILGAQGVSAYGCLHWDIPIRPLSWSPLWYRTVDLFFSRGAARADLSGAGKSASQLALRGDADGDDQSGRPREVGWGMCMARDCSAASVWAWRG